MREVTLQEVLDARDSRAAAQQRLLSAWDRPLISFSMNIAGPVKHTPLIALAFRAATEDLRHALGSDLLACETVDAATGPEALLVCAVPAGELKALTLRLEEERPVGRLYDLDVIGTDGSKLSRSAPRTCLVCGGPVGPCARSRAHGLPAVQAATDALLRDFAADHLADLAVSALLEEAELTPKPGLVDARSSGAHRDMDLELFRRSAACLRSYFREAVLLGLSRADCMPALQQAGRRAEQTMLDTTGGVNTHKGAVYAFGLLLAGLGSVLARGGDLFAAAAALAEAGLPPEDTTHGSEAKRRYGASGARGEALAGFPHARRACGVLSGGGDLHAALLTLLAEVEDTNLLHRGGREGLLFVQNAAAEILAAPIRQRIRLLSELDDVCIARNLSPGGCADLLAAGIFLHRSREIWQNM